MNQTEVVNFWKSLDHKEQTELRAINPQTKQVRSIHFSTEAELLKHCKELEKKFNLYLGVNERKKNGTEAKDIIAVKIIPIDIDCVNKPSTQEDIIEANLVCTQIMSDAVEKGYKKPSCNFSGNGYQLMFHIPEIKITDENRKDVEEKIQEFQKRLIKRYSNEKVRLDNVGDLPRIMRMPGTYNLKSKTFSKTISGEYEEDPRLSEDILDIRVSEVVMIGSLSPELKEKIKDNKKIQELLEGKHNKASRSEAELSLLCHLVRIGLDQEQIFKVMASGKLGKWQTSNLSYRNLSYKKAIELITKEKTPDASSIFTKKEQANVFHERQPIFYDRSLMFWMWDDEKKFWEISDDIDVLNFIEEKTSRDIINSKNRTEILNSLKQIGRKNIPQKFEPNWIQFKDKVYDIETGRSFEATPFFFSANPIDFEISGKTETPVMDKIFEEWVGKKYVQSLYEIIAYSALSDYPIHRLFCLIGSGLNGKSCFLRLLKKFIGINNTATTELDRLMGSRFEVTRLHKKLVCLMGETNFTEMRQTALIKSLTGQDEIAFEYKNKNLFSDTNYAKLIIATNNLPSTTDKTDGWYRRWMIIDFPNKFTEKKEILDDIPEEEYNNLATKCLEILKDLLEKREFTNEGTIKERMEKYEDRSDPIGKFIREYTEEDFNGFIFKFDFEKKLNQWCDENRFRKVSETTIGRKMKNMGMEVSKRQADWLNEASDKRLRAWDGLKWKI